MNKGPTSTQEPEQSTEMSGQIQGQLKAVWVNEAFLLSDFLEGWHASNQPRMRHKTVAVSKLPQELGDRKESFRGEKVS